MNDELLCARGLSKSFQTGEASVEVLTDVNLSIAKGERVAIVGQSGVGKSTLLQILGTLDHPTAGTVMFANQDVFAKSGPELARLRNRQLGFVFQFHHLLPEFDALENVMMPGLIAGRNWGEVRDLASAILCEVGLEHRFGHRVGKLSGGERQRVAVARALVLNPSLVLADEPTGNLDPETGDQITELLLEMNRKRGTTLVVVTHSASLAATLGRTLVLEHGKLREAGGAAASPRAD